MRPSGPERSLQLGALLDIAGSKASKARSALSEKASGTVRDPIRGRYQADMDLLNAIIAGIEPLKKIFGEGFALSSGETIKVDSSSALEMSMEEFRTDPEELKPEKEQNIGCDSAMQEGLRL